MQLCARILVPVVVTIRAIVHLITEVVRTVCDWVTSTITVVKEVCEEVCGWLGPFSFLCDWVCKLVEVVETVTEWVCEEVVERILVAIEVLIEYVFYILQWVCWVIDWVIRLPGLLVCIAGLEPPKVLRVCIKNLAGADGVGVASNDQIDDMLEEAGAILANCNIRLVEASRETIRQPRFLTTTTCDVGGMFRRFFTWFSERACQDSCTFTVYIVDDIAGASGCAYPGANWVTVEDTSPGGTMVQELGHLADLWGHTSDPDNVMTDVAGGTADQITSFQCCMIRTSRFACFSDVDRIVEAATGAVLWPRDI